MAGEDMNVNAITQNAFRVHIHSLCSMQKLFQYKYNLIVSVNAFKENAFKKKHLKTFLFKV